eukprot:TRINITY_DN1750_c0_g2_i4.p1 TRINITY_DN1750_c0_g2~~TRINITY_DN1750_c0_g2_i4.p1  ORF type:complete len:277 (+),score=77.88 TRINITY_DN1750_c0_g2_i4:59-832(+)
MTKFRVIEFFCGIGGFHCALQNLPEYANNQIEVVVAFDNNLNALKTYSHNFPNTPTSSKNISTLKSKEIDSYSANVWVLSPPCQPYTRQGKGLDVKDNRAEALLHLINLISEIKHLPSYILLENVIGFERSQSRTSLVDNLRTFNYIVEEYNLTPTYFNIPNQRARYFLLAKLKPLQFCSAESMSPSPSSPSSSPSSPSSPSPSPSPSFSSSKSNLNHHHRGRHPHHHRDHHHHHHVLSSLPLPLLDSQNFFQLNSS